MPASLDVKIVPSSDENYLGSVVQGMYWLFQALEASRVVCDEILAALDAEGHFTLSPPRVKRLSIGSPLEAFLQTDQSYVVIVALVIGRLIAWRKTYHEGSISKQEARSLKWKQDQEEAADKIDSKELISRAADLIRLRLEDQNVSVNQLGSEDTTKIWV